MDPAEQPGVFQLSDVAFDSLGPVVDGATVTKFGGMRLHTKRYPDAVGGEFVLVDFVMSEATNGDPWSDPDVYVSVVCRGIAYFDGVRHLTWNPTEDGYLYYQDLLALSEALRFISRAFRDTSR
jgi:hypothetical protein